MKKLCILALIFILSTAGCSKPVECSKPFTDIFAELEAQELYTDMLDLTAAEAKEQANIDFSLADEAVYYVHLTGYKADEFALFKAKNESSAAELMSRLQVRIDDQVNMYESYLPEEDALSKKAYLSQKGLYVEMVVSKNKDQILNVLDQYIK